MPYGHRWRRHRALFLQYFNPTNHAIRPVITQEVDTLLLNLSDTPQNLFHHVKRYERFVLRTTKNLNHCDFRTTAAIAMMISYGHQIAPEGDYYVKLADEALSYLARAGIFGTYLVDYISIRRFIHWWVSKATPINQLAQ